MVIFLHMSDIIFNTYCYIYHALYFVNSVYVIS